MRTWQIILLRISLRKSIIRLTCEFCTCRCAPFTIPAFAVPFRFYLAYLAILGIDRDVYSFLRSTSMIDRLCVSPDHLWPQKASNLYLKNFYILYSVWFPIKVSFIQIRKSNCTVICKSINQKHNCYRQTINKAIYQSGN